MSDPQAQDSDFNVFSFLSPEDLQRLGGIPPQAIVGIVAQTGLDSRQFTPETFKPNSVFREYLHEVIGQCGLESPGMQKEARRIGDGHVYIIDRRTPTPQGKVPPEDIIDSFEVKHGQLVSGSYQANTEHKIVSERGLFQLPQKLKRCLVEAMRNLPPVDGEQA